MKKLSAMVWNGAYWSGWSNATGTEWLKSISHAVELIKKDTEQGWLIIDADNLKIYVSDIKFAERAIFSAKSNFGVDVPIESVFVSDLHLV